MQNKHNKGSDLNSIVLNYSKCSRTSPGPWGTWLLGWQRKRDTFPRQEDDWLQLVRDCLVHHWTVSVSLHMRFKTLMCVAPGHIENLVAWSSPGLIALQSRHEDLSAFSVDEIHKGISKAAIGVKINWKVHQIVRAFETLPIEQLQQRIASVTIWNVTQH